LKIEKESIEADRGKEINGAGALPEGKKGNQSHHEETCIEPGGKAKGSPVTNGNFFLTEEEGEGRKKNLPRER